MLAAYHEKVILVNDQLPHLLPSAAKVILHCRDLQMVHVAESNVSW